MQTRPIRFMLVFLVCFCSLVCGQKSYQISSLVSTISVQSSNCKFSVVEEFEYSFNGSYSKIGRALPQFIMQIDSSIPIKAEVLTSGYEISARLTYGSESTFIASTFSPPTPSNSLTRVSIRLSYSIQPKVIYKENIPYLQHYYKDASSIESLSSTFIFDSSVKLAPKYSSGGIVSIINNAYQVSFNHSNIPPNTEIQPFVSSVELPVCSIDHIRLDTALGISIPIVSLVSIVLIGFGCYMLYSHYKSKKSQSNRNITISELNNSKVETTQTRNTPKVQYSNTAVSTTVYVESTTAHDYSSSTYDYGHSSGYDYGGGSNGCDYGGGGGGGCDYGGGGGCDGGGTSGYAD